jgi:hypothetical protein
VSRNERHRDTPHAPGPLLQAPLDALPRSLGVAIGAVRARLRRQAPPRVGDRGRDGGSPAGLAGVVAGGVSSRNPAGGQPTWGCFSLAPFLRHLRHPR